MEPLDIIIRSAYAHGFADASVMLGVTAGEISQRKARELYGKWFSDAVHNGRIRPVRVDNGHRGTKRFLVTDILALRTSDAAKAQVKLLNTTQL